MKNNTIKTAGTLFVVFMVLYELTVNLSNDMYLPAVPAIQQFFQAKYSYMQLTLTCWFAGSIIMNPVLGALADARGKRKLLLSSGVIFTLATLYCTFGTSPWLFLLARFWQGLTVTSIVICGYALIHEIYNDKQAIMVVAWMSSALITAPMLGPLLGGYLVYHANWRFVFVFLACCAMLALSGLYFLMPSSNADLINTPINIKKVFSDYKKILSKLDFLLPSLMAGATYGGFIAWITVSPYLIMVQNHYSSLEFGFLQLPIFGSYVLGTILLSFCVKSMSEDKIIMTGMMILTFDIAACSTIIFNGYWNFITLMIGLAVYSFGVGFMSSSINRMLTRSSEYGMGKVMAMFDFILGVIATITTIALSVDAADLTAYLGWVLCAYSLFTVICYFVQQFKARLVHAKSIN